MSQNLRNPSAQVNSFPTNERLAVMYTAGRNLQARKSADQGVTNSALLVNDTELGVYLATQPKSAYYFCLTLHLVISNAAHNFKYSFVAPDGMVIDQNFSRWAGIFYINGVIPQVDANQNNVVAVISGGATNAWTLLKIEGVVRPEQPGYFGLQWAQATAGASTTTVKAGSSFMAWEISA